jgi:hypothetical protein
MRKCVWSDIDLRCTRRRPWATGNAKQRPCQKVAYVITPTIMKIATKFISPSYKPDCFNFGTSDKFPLLMFKQQDGARAVKNNQP